MSNVDGSSLYVGVTNDISRRVIEHGIGVGSAFTSSGDVSRLVWCEEHFYIKNAIAREKQLKAGSRAQKLALIEEMNPKWRDLSGDVF
jgi:putative endonuclease